MQELLEKYQKLRDDLMEELSHRSYETQEETDTLDAYKHICWILSDMSISKGYRLDVLDYYALCSPVYEVWERAWVEVNGVQE